MSTPTTEMNAVAKVLGELTDLMAEYVDVHELNDWPETRAALEKLLDDREGPDASTVRDLFKLLRAADARAAEAAKSARDSAAFAEKAWEEVERLRTDADAHELWHAKYDALAASVAESAYKRMDGAAA